MNTYRVTIGPDVTHLSLPDLDALREYYRARYPELELEGPLLAAGAPRWAMLVGDRVLGSVEQTNEVRS